MSMPAPKLNETSEFWRGVRWAIGFLETEAHDLSDIRDGYIEARASGTHSGRRIRPETAKEFAGKFHERSDAVHMAAELLAGIADDHAKVQP